MRYIFESGEEDCLKLDLNTGRKINENLFQLNVEYEDGKKKELFVRMLAGKFYFSLNGLSWKKIAPIMHGKDIVFVERNFKVFRGFRPSGAQKLAAGTLVTQMPGKIRKVLVSPGQTVAKDRPLIIIEAMKMENEIKSNVAGVVKAIYVEEGQAVETGHKMLEIEE